MPVQTRPSDTFTRDNLLLGFSVVEFTPTGSSTAVPLGILSSQALQKEVETLALERGDSGTLTVDREIISRLSVSMNLELFNFKANVAQYIFGAESLTTVTADAAAAGDTDVTLASTNPFDYMLDLSHGDITESSIEVTFNTITNEAVGTGDGVTNAFRLNQKVKAVANVTSVTVNGVAYTPVAAGAAATGLEVEVIVGETDGAAGTGSGSLSFWNNNVADPPGAGEAIVATYTPGFSTTGTDIVNLTDFVVDPTFGRIRFLDPAGANNSPFRPDSDSDVGGTSLNVAYTYNRRASTSMKPFTSTTFEGSVVIRHLPDYGVNFIWTIPSATIRITADDLTFGAEDFAVATLQLNINDAGGTDRFGTLLLSSETEAGA